jgi:hypothetical protein
MHNPNAPSGPNRARTTAVRLAFVVIALGCTAPATTPPPDRTIGSAELGRAQGGSIVLMHLGGYETLDALPGIVAGLRASGYTLVTLGTLVGE